MALSLEQLVVLPYGENAVVSDGDSPTMGELLALPYTGNSPSAKGLAGRDFRKGMRGHGERVGWLRAIQSDTTHNRRDYLPMLLPDEVRVFIYQTEVDIQDEEFGLIRKGETMLSWMPDELAPMRDDRFVALDRPQNERQVLEPSPSISRALSHTRITSIEAMYEEGEPVETTNYELVNGSILWINGYLPVVVVEVFYAYLPMYEYLSERARQGPMGQDGVRLPGRAPLRLLSGKEE